MGHVLIINGTLLALQAKARSRRGSPGFLHQDVSLEEAQPGVIEVTERRFGRLDVMVANAGIGILCKAIEMSLADWRRQTAVNLDGVFLSVKHAVPAMRRAGGGSIIIMSSVAGLRGSAGLASYCATKGAVRLVANAVAMEGAAAGNAIRVNTVHPGVIDTPIWTKLPVAAGSNAPIDPNEVAKTGYRSEGPGRPRISRMVCCSSPRMRPAT
jgi:NAD(P)-dependent dehydrogenase (short-subunit alcohol dehydrogenase family)